MTDGFKKVAEEVVYETGAQRDAGLGKGAWHWIPWDALFLVSRIYEIGNIQRGIRNWERGMPIDGYVRSAISHLGAYLAGDRAAPHLSQAAWNVLCAIQTSIWVYMGWRPKELNQLPNHRSAWVQGDEPACPLSPEEIKWLKTRGIERNAE